MLNFLNLISSDHGSLMAFQSDPEGFLKRFDEISPEERKILLSRDSIAVEQHLKRALLKDEGIVSVHGATTVTIVAVVVVLAPATEFGVLDGEEVSAVQQRLHNDFWSHVTERGEAHAY